MTDYSLWHAVGVKHAEKQYLRGDGLNFTGVQHAVDPATPVKHGKVFPVCQQLCGATSHLFDPSSRFACGRCLSELGLARPQDEEPVLASKTSASLPKGIKLCKHCGSPIRKAGPIGRGPVWWRGPVGDGSKDPDHCPVNVNHEPAPLPMVREVRKSRQTGTNVLLIDAAHPDNVDFDDIEGAGRWVTFCEPHGSYVQHQDLATARSFLPLPKEWCAACDGQDSRYS